MRRVDSTEAERVMRAAGCIPLVPFPGAGAPWPCIHEPCGREIAPTYSNVRKRGRACRACGDTARGATRRGASADAAVETMRAAGFEPLEPYPGSSRPWRCIHTRCGQERTPTLNTIRAHGTACRECSHAIAGRTAWTAEAAERAFRGLGLEPLEPWPGSSSKAWRATHLACGRVVSPRLGNVVAGQGPCRECGQEATHSALRKDHDDASALMRDAGLEPIEPFPGVDRPWHCRHLPCGREVAPTYTNVKRGQGGCIRCAAEATSKRLLMPESDARTIMLANGLEPLEPYPGSLRPWRCRHSCGNAVTPTLSNVSAGRGICRYCNSAFPYAGPAILYLIVDHDNVKVGCASPSGNRLYDHSRFGWQVAWTLETPTGDDAYNLEQGILSWWRNELALPPSRSAASMPQTGYSETACWEEMHPAFVLAKASQLADDLGLPALPFKPTRFLEERPGELAGRLGVRARARQPGPGQEPLDFG